MSFEDKYRAMDNFLETVRFAELYLNGDPAGEKESLEKLQDISRAVKPIKCPFIDQVLCEEDDDPFIIVQTGVLPKNIFEEDIQILVPIIAQLYTNSIFQQNYNIDVSQVQNGMFDYYQWSPHRLLTDIASFKMLQDTDPILGGLGALWIIYLSEFAATSSTQ